MIGICNAARLDCKINHRRPKHVWNRVPDEVKRKVVDFDLQETELSPRELAVTFTDQERYFILRIYSVARAVGPRSDHQPCLHRHQGSQRVQRQDNCDQPALADRLHLPQGISAGAGSISAPILDDYSRYIVSWKLCTNMRAAGCD